MALADEIRKELKLINPSPREVGKLTADALDALDRRLQAVENATDSHDASDIRHGETGPIRTRKRR